MGIFRATNYHWKENASNRLHVDLHKNLGTKKPRTHTLQATAALYLMLEQSNDPMPHKTRTLESREKVVFSCCPSSWHSKDSLLELNIINVQLSLNIVSPTRLSRIRNESFSKYSIKNGVLILLDVVSMTK
jgi:hypothetical protein